MHSSTSRSLSPVVPEHRHSQRVLFCRCISCAHSFNTPLLIPIPGLATALEGAPQATISFECALNFDTPCRGCSTNLRCPFGVWTPSVAVSPCHHCFHIECFASKILERPRRCPALGCDQTLPDIVTASHTDGRCPDCRAPIPLCTDHCAAPSYAPRSDDRAQRLLSAIASLRPPASRGRGIGVGIEPNPGPPKATSLLPPPWLDADDPAPDQPPDLHHHTLYIDIVNMPSISHASHHPCCPECWIGCFPAPRITWSNNAAPVYGGLDTCFKCKLGFLCRKRPTRQYRCLHLSCGCSAHICCFIEFMYNATMRCISPKVPRRFHSHGVMRCHCDTCRLNNYTPLLIPTHGKVAAPDAPPVKITFACVVKFSASCGICHKSLRCPFGVYSPQVKVHPCHHDFHISCLANYLTRGGLSCPVAPCGKLLPHVAIAPHNDGRCPDCEAPIPLCTHNCATPQGSPESGERAHLLLDALASLLPPESRGRGIGVCIEPNPGPPDEPTFSWLLVPIFAYAEALCRNADPRTSFERFTTSSTTFTAFFHHLRDQHQQHLISEAARRIATSLTFRQAVFDDTLPWTHNDSSRPHYISAHHQHFIWSLALGNDPGLLVQRLEGYAQIFVAGRPRAPASPSQAAAAADSLSTSLGRDRRATRYGNPIRWPANFVLRPDDEECAACLMALTTPSLVRRTRDPTDICPVCQVPISCALHGSTIIYVTLECSHPLHRSCATQLQRDTCPLCRAPFSRATHDLPPRPQAARCQLCEMNTEPLEHRGLPQPHDAERCLHCGLPFTCPHGRRPHYECPNRHLYHACCASVLAGNLFPNCPRCTHLSVARTSSEFSSVIEILSMRDDAQPTGVVRRLTAANRPPPAPPHAPPSMFNLPAAPSSVALNRRFSTNRFNWNNLVKSMIQHPQHLQSQRHQKTHRFLPHRVLQMLEPRRTLPQMSLSRLPLTRSPHSPRSPSRPRPSINPHPRLPQMPHSNPPRACPRRPLRNPPTLPLSLDPNLRLHVLLPQLQLTLT